MLNFWTDNYTSLTFWAWVTILFFAGAIISYILSKFISSAKHHFHLEKCILWVSFLGAGGCLALSFAGYETVSIQILSFYVSFIFAWLLTKESSQKEFRRMQHKVAKNTYRHIEDVETTVLITKARVEELCTKGNEMEGELQGIVDDLNSILTGIRSNKDDWKDMLKKSYRKKIENQEDPEGRLEKLKSQPDTLKLKEEFKDDLKNANCNL